MDINFICTRKRKEFGKPCAFVNVGPEFLFEVDPDPVMGNDFIKLSTVDRSINNSVKMCAHEINTQTFPTENRGMNHKEGGWPASVDNEDDESMARFRKKIEKDKHYVNAVKSLSQFIEHFVMENTSVDIYEEYFENERIKCNTKESFSVNSIFKDLNAPHRSVIDMSWEKNSTKFAAVYASKRGKIPVMPSFHSYVWNVENNIQPIYTMKPELPMTVVEFSPFDSNLILSGYVSGQIALWDIRTNGYVQQLSPIFNSHRNKVTGIKWLHSKHGTAFFSGACDGILLSWDCRNLSKPTEVNHLDWKKDHIASLEEDFSISCVEYDESVPYKFMIGAEQGNILSFNRKYKQNEDKLRSVYKCGSGPIFNIERNAFFPQLFLSCDAWSLKMWSENVTDNPILNTISKDGYYTDAAWSPTRVSTTFASKTTGILEVWDLPGKIKEPLLNVKLDDESLLSVAVAESGKYLICGALSGSIQMLNIPDYLQRCSETEKYYLKECIKECEVIIGGSPRSERGPTDETDAKEIEREEDWWDPPEKAEDLCEENWEFFTDVEKSDFQSSKVFSSTPSPYPSHSVSEIPETSSASVSTSAIISPTSPSLSNSTITLPLSPFRSTPTISSSPSFSSLSPTRSTPTVPSAQSSSASMIPFTEPLSPPTSKISSSLSTFPSTNTSNQLPSISKIPSSQSSSLSTNSSTTMSSTSNTSSKS